MKSFKDHEAVHARVWDIASVISDALDDEPPSPRPVTRNGHDSSSTTDSSGQPAAPPAIQRFLNSANPSPTLVQRLRTPNQGVGQHQGSQTNSINGASINSRSAFNVNAYGGSGNRGRCRPQNNYHSRSRSATGNGADNSRCTRSFLPGSGRGGHNDNNRAHSTRGIGYHGSRAASSGDRVSSGGSSWPGPAILTTTRRAEDIKVREEKRLEAEKYLKPASVNEILPNIASTLAPRDLYFGYYLWPISQFTPQDLLGLTLDQLNPIRIKFSVHIDWHPFTRCLIVSSPSLSGENVLLGIEAVRKAAQGADAARLANAAVFIVVPPTTNAMRSVVRPTTIVKNPSPAEHFAMIGSKISHVEQKVIDEFLAYKPEPPNESGDKSKDPAEKTKVPPKGLSIATDLELFGEKLSEEERLDWSAKRPGIVAKNRNDFKNTLIKGLTRYEPVKSWMRMRVAYGHIYLKSFKPSFGASKMSFENFEHMMSHPRVGGGFNKKMKNVAMVTQLRARIVNWPERFNPVQAQTKTLGEVRWKDTAVIFITTNSNESLRAEVEVDRVYEDDIVVSKYQIGASRILYDGKQAEKLEITNIDVEREIDWKLEVITDSQIASPPKEIVTLIESSVTPRTKVGVDSLGLDYPKVTPFSTNNLHATHVTVKSVIQYMMDASGYIVEIAVYRDWEGSSTSMEPTLKTSVSLFHPSWDYHLESIENTTKLRNFGPELANLFKNGPEGTNGLDNFLTEVETIQGFLVDATKSAQKASGATVG